MSVVSLLLLLASAASAQDADGDTVPDAVEDRNGDNDLTNDDTDGDGTPDYLDADDDGDGVPTLNEVQWSPNDTHYLTNDADNDGVPDGVEWLNWLTWDGSQLTAPPACGTYSGSSSRPVDKPTFDPTTGTWSCALDPVQMQNYGWGTPPGDDEAIRDGAYDFTNPATPVFLLASTQTGRDWDDPWDRDGDGTPNFLDVDDDGDGVLTSFETTADIAEICPGFGGNITTPGDGIPSYLDRDSDGDALLDWQETLGGSRSTFDVDQDGIWDWLDCSTNLYTDTDKDGLYNTRELSLGTNPFEPDTDGDGVRDGLEASDTAAPDTDGDGVPDVLDDDDDGDGIFTFDELAPQCRSQEQPVWVYRGLIPGTEEWAWWCDPDGVGLHRADLANTDRHQRQDPAALEPDTLPDYLDSDDDGDTTPTLDEFAGWCPNQGQPPSPDQQPTDPDDWRCPDDSAPDPLLTDRDDDGITDHLDLDDADGPTADWDGDGLDNQTEQDLGTDWQSVDSDDDGIEDRDEIGDASRPADTDGDGTIDALDPDDDDDGIPTATEGAGDLDGDGVPDHLDTDSDGDGVPDGDENGLDADCDVVFDHLDAVDDQRCGAPHTPGDTCGCATGNPGPAWVFLFLLPLLPLRRNTP